jgi:hypothetical protein
MSGIFNTVNGLAQICGPLVSGGLTGLIGYPLTCDTFGIYVGINFILYFTLCNGRYSLKESIRKVKEYRKNGPESIATAEPLLKEEDIEKSDDSSQLIGSLNADTTLEEDII